MPDKEKENMALWDAVCETDPAYTKPGEYGSRKFTALDAYRQIMAATARWGPVGKGWGWTATFHTAQAEDKDGKFTVGWCVMELWHETREQHYTTTGGAVVDRKGEWEKKALTDAITKGLSYLGYNADVFLGKFDDNKYVAEMNAKHANEHRPDRAGEPTAKSGQAADAEIASAASLRKFNTLGVQVWGKDGWTKARGETVTWASNGRVSSAAQMNQPEMDAAIDYLESQSQPTEGAPAWNRPSSNSN